MAPQRATTRQLADYLMTGYWRDDGGSPHQFSSATIKVSFAGLSDAAKALAKAAFQAWETVADIDFVESGDARISFSMDYNGTANAKVWHDPNGGEIDKALVRIDPGWLSGKLSSSQQDDILKTLIHEIGHTLGLGHAGPYDGNSSYASDAKFRNDSWQQTVLSYFDQDENTHVNADRAVPVTPMMADILAIQDLYGRPDGGPTAGDTRYGVGSNLGTYLDAVFEARGLLRNAMTIFDVGGADTIDFRDDTRGQVVDLNGGAFSSVYGKTGNLGIAQGTRIENYVAGSGSDKVTGNGASNTISLASGNDQAWGKGGRDVLWGGNGNDTLAGGDGNDVLNGQAGNDRLTGGTGADIFVFTGGRDTITGFGDDRDTLKLDDSLWGGGSRSWTQILAMAKRDVVDGDLRLDFGGGDVLTIRDMTGVLALKDDWGLV